MHAQIYIAVVLPNICALHIIFTVDSLVTLTRLERPTNHRLQLQGSVLILPWWVLVVAHMFLPIFPGGFQCLLNIFTHIYI